MQFSLAFLSLAAAGFSFAAAIPNDLTSRQSLTLDNCASVSSTLVALVNDIVFEQDGGLVGEIKAIIAGAGGAVTVSVFPIGGCVGAAVSTVVNDLSRVTNVLVDAAIDAGTAVARTSFTITV